MQLSSLNHRGPDTTTTHHSTFLKPNTVSSLHSNQVGVSFSSKTSQQSRVPPKNRKAQILKIGQRRDWRGIVQLFDKKKEQFNLSDCVISLSQLAKIQPPKLKYDLLDGLVDHLADLTDKKPLDARCYSSIVHSITKLKLQTASANRIIDHLLDVSFVKRFLHDCPAQSMAMTFWSLAKRNKTSSFQVVLENVTHSNMEALFQGGESTQSAANTAWACGTMKRDNVNLFSLINTHANWLVANGHPQNIAIIA